MVFDETQYLLATKMSHNEVCNYADYNQNDLITNSNHDKVERFISKREVKTPDQEIVPREKGPEGMMNTNDDEPHETRRDSKWR